MFKRIISWIPNTITLLNLVSGALACVMAFRGGEMLAWGLNGTQWAFLLIGGAAVFDFLDGASARLLGAYSELGKQLDSLSDLVSFGVAPSMLALNATLALGGSAWVAYFSLFVAAMGALRLARFNIDTRQTTYFIGLPIPANAILWIGVIQLLVSRGYPGDWAMGAIITASGLMMVCSLPMFSLKFKNFALRPNLSRYILIAAAIAFVAIFGLQGLAWTIIFYIILSAVTARQTVKQ